MIKSIRLVNFKNFADETLRVGPFTVIVGANASGKSNIRDAFRFLHGIGRGYKLAEIFGGKYGGGGQHEWEPIRGAADEIVRFGQLQFSLEVEFKLNDTELHYLIEVEYDPASRSRFQLLKEKLTSDTETIFEAYSSDMQLKIRTPETSSALPLSHLEQPILSQIVRGLKIPYKFSYRRSCYEIHHLLNSMRFLEPSSDRMREPSFPGVNILGDSGENLPTVLEEACADPNRREILASWVHELTPMDIKDFEFPRDPSGRIHLTLCESNGRKVSAYSASDGTLRFLAMLAAMLGTNPSNFYFFEEIDNGIHPVRLNLLTDLIERQTAKHGIQVLTTTHAPTLLTVMNDNTFEHTSVVCRLEDTSDAIIRPIAELPNVRELRQDQGLGRLHESGWMEDALFFNEDYDEAEHGS